MQDAVIRKREESGYREDKAAHWVLAGLRLSEPLYSRALDAVKSFGWVGGWGDSKG